MKNFSLAINGKNYNVNIKSAGSDKLELEVNGSAYKVQVSRDSTSSKTPQLIRPKTQPSTESEKSTAKTSNPLEKKGSGTIKAPLPGVVINVFVKEGDNVIIGTNLLVWEAMKMENNLSSDREGKVRSVRVKPGDSILEGDVLIEIE